MNVENDSDHDPYAYRNYIANNYLWPFVPSIFLIIGTVANSLSILIFTRSEMRKHSSFVYFAFLNIVNLGALYTNCIRGVFDFNFDIDIRSQNLYICKFHVFLTYFLCHLSSLILSSISVDRVISVMFICLSKKTCTPKVAIQVTTCLAIFTALLSSHFLYLESGFKSITETYIDNVTGVIESVTCDIRHPSYNYFVQNIWKLVDMSMYAFIPFFIMLTSSMIIIFKIAEQSKKLQTHDKDSRFSARTRNLALMLIPVNVMFLIFVGPVVVAIYIYKDLGQDQLALVIVEVLSNCNFTLNFFIYFVTSSKFRDEFYKVLDKACQILKIGGNSSGNKNSMNNINHTINQTKRPKVKRMSQPLVDDMSKQETVGLTVYRENEF